MLTSSKAQPVWCLHAEWEAANETELLARITDAKARVCIYGEEAVIRDLSKFWAVGASFETESGILAFTRFCMNIRRPFSISDSEPLNDEVSTLLFSITPKGASDADSESNLPIGRAAEQGKETRIQFMNHAHVTGLCGAANPRRELR